MLKNHSNLLNQLSKISNDVGVIHLTNIQINDEMKDLIDYLADGNLAPHIWTSNHYPIHIFTNQFNSELLITITEKEQLDPFSRDFSRNKKIINYQDLTN